ncbi:MAG: hypothetical protein OXU61_02580 [Gammaproteobacteria bacterium]|nr:hypothetical protein [Gammaproteobacteria bacterium]
MRFSLRPILPDLLPDLFSMNRLFILTLPVKRPRHYTNAQCRPPSPDGKKAGDGGIAI